MPSTILFAGVRFFFAGVITVLIYSIASGKLLYPQKANIGKIAQVSVCLLYTSALYYPIWREKTYAAEDEKTLPQDCCKPRYVIVDGIAHPYTKYSQLPDAFTLRYEAYPADIPDNAPDETEFDLPDEAVLAVIFFAAAQTQSMEYDQRFFQSFYAQYQGKLSNLSGMTDGPTAVVMGLSLIHIYAPGFCRRGPGAAQP